MYFVAFLITLQGKPRYWIKRTHNESKCRTAIDKLVIEKSINILFVITESIQVQSSGGVVNYFFFKVEHRFFSCFTGTSNNVKYLSLYFLVSSKNTKWIQNFAFSAATLELPTKFVLLRVEEPKSIIFN